MQLKIYNSLSGEKEIFKPILEGNVGMYVCGPTVYSNVHLGNVRTFLSFDFIYRSLTNLGYKVRYVRNITDAGHLTDDGDVNNDRFVKQTRLEKLEPMEIVQKYTVDFHKVLEMFIDVRSIEINQLEGWDLNPCRNWLTYAVRKSNKF